MQTSVIVDVGNKMLATRDELKMELQVFLSKLFFLFRGIA